MNWWQRFKHRQKLSVAIPINNEAYEILKKLWKPEDRDMGDTIIRLYNQAQKMQQWTVSNNDY